MTIPPCARIALALAFAAPLPALAQLRLQAVASGLEGPTALAQPDDGSGRLFVLERPGRIRVIEADGTLAATPWYQREVNTHDTEQGLLGIAFDPGFRDNGTVYIAYSATPVEQWGLVVRRLSAGDPSAATFEGGDRQLLRVTGLVANHNGGDLHLGRDGMLYVSVGAGTGKPEDHPWAGSTDDLRGKILRLDVRPQARPARGAGTCGGDGGRVGYGIPEDNPWAGQAGQCGEIWLYGLRNPWRFALDPFDGAIWIGDVGVDREELTRWHPDQPLRDLGFPRCQAHHDWPSTGATDCPARTGTLAPVYAYAGGDNGRCAIIGGRRYRGPVAALAGAYVFGDACSGELLAARADGAGWRVTPLPVAMPRGYGSISGFGEDVAGHLYVLDHAHGTVHRLEAD